MNDVNLLGEQAARKARTQILAAAATLIRQGGPEAATTRAVAAAASVQAPTIYRLIGDKDALLDAVAEYVLGSYVASKKRKALPSDPLEALKEGWDRYVAFGLANPGLFWIISKNARSPAAMAGRKVLAERIHAVAMAGRLCIGEERASAMLHAACVGTVLTLLAEGGVQANPHLSTDAREAALMAITCDSQAVGAGNEVAVAATTLRARLGESTGVLTQGERGLLDEFLVRLARAV
ncbi:TetR/AcrR family transcriptional regulator [Burkholderia gladioli]|nr:TetR/AcrR family transcriptional regulator [Burkholderia gladioli]MDN7500219.1 TetR/AcrR family transcriptional regulator [Burkholderia gladioli]